VWPVALGCGLSLFPVSIVAVVPFLFFSFASSPLCLPAEEIFPSHAVRLFFQQREAGPSSLSWILIPLPFCLRFPGFVPLMRVRWLESSSWEGLDGLNSVIFLAVDSSADRIVNFSNP